MPLRTGCGAPSQHRYSRILTDICQESLINIELSNTGARTSASSSRCFSSRCLRSSAALRSARARLASFSCISDVTDYKHARSCRLRLDCHASVHEVSCRLLLIAYRFRADVPVPAYAHHPGGWG